MNGTQITIVSVTVVVCLSVLVALGKIPEVVVQQVGAALTAGISGFFVGLVRPQPEFAKPKIVHTEGEEQ